VWDPGLGLASPHPAAAGAKGLAEELVDVFRSVTAVPLQSGSTRVR